MTVPEPLTLHAALLRAFTTASVPGEPHQCLTENPQKAADIAARVTEAYVAAAEVRAWAMNGDGVSASCAQRRTVQRVIAAGHPAPGRRTPRPPYEPLTACSAPGCTAWRQGRGSIASEAAIRAGTEAVRGIPAGLVGQRKAARRACSPAQARTNWPLGPVMGAPAREEPRERSGA